MTEVPEAHKRAITTHTAQGEAPEAVHVKRNRTVAVTESRLISVRSKPQSRRSELTVQSLDLRHIVNISVEMSGPESVDAGALIIAAVFGVGGVGAFAFWLGNSGTSVAPLAGLVLLGIAAVIAAIALDKNDGEATLTIATTSGSTRSIELPGDESDFAATVSGLAVETAE